MAFTYTEGGSTDIDRVRFAIGATDPSEVGVIQNAAITQLVSQRGSWQGAVAEVFWRRHADLSRQADNVTTQEGSYSYGGTLAALKAQAERWDREAAAAAETTTTSLPRAVIRRLGQSPSDRGNTRV